MNLKIRKLISPIVGDRKIELANESMFTKNFVPQKHKKSIGDYTYGKIEILEWGEGASLKIGKFCSIADGTKIMLGGEHRTEWITTYPFPEIFKTWKEAKSIKGHPKTKGNVEIGNDVWIGTGVIVLSGVQIGDGAVIGAGSIVSKDIKPYSISAGIPAKTIKLRFSQSKIKQLLDLKWWDWPEIKIRKNVRLLCSPRIEELVKKGANKSLPSQNKQKLMSKKMRKRSGKKVC